MARREQIAACRLELDTLSELLAASEQMSQEIRMARTPLPRLLDRLGKDRDGLVGVFFQDLADAIKQGEAADIAWRRGVETLPLGAQERAALAECALGLSGDEERVTQAIALARLWLGRSLEEKHRVRAEREKRATALCLSAAALLVIILI